MSKYEAQIREACDKFAALLEGQLERAFADSHTVAYAFATAKRFQIARQRGFACVGALNLVRFRTLNWPYVDAHLGARRATHNRAR